MKTTNEYKQNILVRILVITCLSAVLGLAGCQQEGTAEKAGQKIDRAAEKAEQKIERATEQANQKIDAAKESLDQKASEAGEYVDKSTDASKRALEKAGGGIGQAVENVQQKIEQSTEKAGKELEGAKESVIDKAETSGEYINDTVLTLNVKSAIESDAMLKTSHIEVTTVNGVVKLSGTVDSGQMIGRAMEIANNQKDVKSVQTALIVKTTASGN